MFFFPHKRKCLQKRQYPFMRLIQLRVGKNPQNKTKASGRHLYIPALFIGIFIGTQ